MSKNIYDLRQELKSISEQNAILFMLLVRTCLKKYGFSFRDVSSDEQTMLDFYTNSRLRIALKLYNEMFLGKSENKNKPSPEHEINKNFKKEAVNLGKEIGPGLVTILGLQPNELNAEKNILDKKLKNLMKQHHPDQFDENEKKEHTKKFQAAVQMKDFLNNGVLEVYLNEKRKINALNKVNLHKKKTIFQEENEKNKMLVIENDSANSLNKKYLIRDELMKDQIHDKVERKHPQFPTREEVKKNPKLAYSDHLMILTKVPMGENKKFLNIISLNVLGGVACSGIHPREVIDDDKVNYDDRYERMATGIKNGVDMNEVDIILLQEISPKDVNSLKEKLGNDWEIIIDDRVGIISCYNKNRLNLQKSSLNQNERIRTMTFMDNKNGHMTVDVHNIWGIFNDFPNSMETVCKNALMSTKSTVSVIIGDTNSRIAPIDDKKRNLTTGLVPRMFNCNYNVDDNYQVTDHPDGGFYRSEDNKIHQLTTEILDFEKGVVVEDNREEHEVNVFQDYRMVMCLDETYKTKQVINGQTVFEYEEMLKDKLGIQNLMVRMSSDSFNNKAVGIRFPKKSPVFQFILQKLEKVEGFKFKKDVTSSAIIDSQVPFDCVFIPLDKAELLNNAINDYLIECDNIVNQLKKLTNECMQNVGMFRDAYKVLESLKNILDPLIPHPQGEASNQKIERFFGWLENEKDGKSNFNIIKDDNSRATGKFIAGILSIIAVIATLPIGLAVMVGVHAYRSHQGKNETLPHHLFKPHKKGKDFSEQISGLNPEKNNLNK